jgi:hypothetical protein
VLQDNAVVTEARRSVAALKETPPRAHAADRAAREPSASPGWPLTRTRDAGWATVPLGQANSVGPRAEMPTQHYTMIFFSNFHFSFNISEIYINFKNAYKIQYYSEKYKTNFCILLKSSCTHRN